MLGQHHPHLVLSLRQFSCRMSSPGRRSGGEHIVSLGGDRETALMGDAGGVAECPTQVRRLMIARVMMRQTVSPLEAHLHLMYPHQW